MVKESNKNQRHNDLDLSANSINQFIYFLCSQIDRRFPTHPLNHSHVLKNFIPSSIPNMSELNENFEPNLPNSSLDQPSLLELVILYTFRLSAVISLFSMNIDLIHQTSKRLDKKPPRKPNLVSKSIRKENKNRFYNDSFPLLETVDTKTIMMKHFLTSLPSLTQFINRSKLFDTKNSHIDHDRLNTQIAYLDPNNNNNSFHRSRIQSMDRNSKPKIELNEGISCPNCACMISIIDEKPPISIQFSLSSPSSSSLLSSCSLSSNLNVLSSKSNLEFPIKLLNQTVFSNQYRLKFGVKL